MTSRARSHVAPDIPTVIEAGIQSLVSENFIGVSAPARLPEAVGKKLHAAIQASLDDPTVCHADERARPDGAKNVAAEFAKFVAEQVQGWAEPVKASGAKLN